jgi:hypothetical protein
MFSFPRNAGHLCCVLTCTGVRPVLVRYQYSPPGVQRMRDCLLNIAYVIFQESVYSTIECINTSICTDNHARAIYIYIYIRCRDLVPGKNWLLASIYLVSTACFWMILALSMKYHSTAHLLVTPGIYTPRKMYQA